MAKILVVDDDPDVVEACRLVLEKEGHEVSEAGNLEDARTAVQAVKPDLLILDVMMEQADDGMVLAQSLRRDGVKTPILMMTSVGRVSGMAIGKDEDLVPVDVFLEKPVSPATLIAKVNELLGN